MSRDELRSRRCDVTAVAGRHGVSHLRVFGSVARGVPDDASDIDLLVDLEPGRTLLDLEALELAGLGVLGLSASTSPDPAPISLVFVGLAVAIPSGVVAAQEYARLQRSRGDQRHDRD